MTDRESYAEVGISAPRVEVLGYREWAFDAFMRAQQAVGSAAFMMFRERIDDVLPDAKLVHLVGWSDMVPPEFYRDRVVLVTHPSMLPAYRGGSPIQHQIIDGLDVGGVTLFKLDEEYPSVDSGPIAYQEPMSLAGDLSVVLDRIARVAARGIATTTLMWRNDRLVLSPQGDADRPRLRRTPEQSEITSDELATSSALELHNKIRALQDPYPNAFIVCADGRRLYLTGSYLVAGEFDAQGATAKPAT